MPTLSDYQYFSGTVYHEFIHLTPFHKIREKFPEEFKLESELKDDPDVMDNWNDWRGDKDEEHWYEFLAEYYEEFDGYYHDVNKSGSYEYDSIMIWKEHQDILAKEKAKLEAEVKKYKEMYKQAVEEEEEEEEEEEDEECGECGSCGVKLDHCRDGTVVDGHRCHNCYWEEEGGNMRAKDVAPLIYPDYRYKEE